MVAVNHMNHDVAEVNGSDPPMLPGSFLYEKEPGYKANHVPHMNNKNIFTLQATIDILMLSA